MSLYRFSQCSLYHVSLVVFAFVWAGIASGQQSERPNVLFIISDDLNNFQGCYGDPLARTPNIDRLAERGVLFDRSYCTYPLCGPSRNSLLTGLYPNSTGILQNSQIFRQTIPQQLSLPQAFRLDGYFAARIGKLYHYNVPKSIGTNGHDDPGSWELELNPAGVDRLEEEAEITTLTPGQFGGTLSWYASPKSDEHHTDGLLAADANWVLQRCAKQSRPFFLAVGFYRPHTPYVAPRDPYFGFYPKDKMPLIQNVSEDQKDIPAAGLASYKREQDKLTDALRRECLQAYYASISFMDAQVGAVVDSLDRLGLSDNTIIVFTSDHGYHMGEHGLWQKMSLFEQSSRVPMLIVAPGAKANGSIVKTPVSHVDLFPTLAELCQVKAPANLQGQSLVPMLEDASTIGRGWSLTQVKRGGTRKQGARTPSFFGYSLRTERWRYTEWDSGEQGTELYDHHADPQELHNLASLPEHAATLQQLSQQLENAVATTFPESGVTPAVRPVTWAPNLTDP
ncbi:sulfatase [Aureliella helgolandensis]|uniref:Choline-sulfatase n=1 Tax=Aureliella helgolandensis TaxID=2527968 RepID=A0A518G813_9BACT|nr:sulfatase [Aureliella helgolandensis]QDV24728.1 Choline-sulfatase [Aureliella helgolandensis]